MLDVRSKMTLDFAGRRWKYPGAKAEAIRVTFSETPTRFYQRLDVLLDEPEALAYSPAVVRRLRRLREVRRAARSVVP